MKAQFSHICTPNRVWRATPPNIIFKALERWWLIFNDFKDLFWMTFLWFEVWAIWCIAWLCRTMRRPFICGCVHVDSSCGHVLIAWFWHSVGLGLGGLLAIRCFLGGFPCIEHIKIIVFCIICTSEMPLAFQKWFDSLWWICTLETHLSTYVNLFFKMRSSCSQWNLYMYVHRLHISP